MSYVKHLICDYHNLYFVLLVSENRLETWQYIVVCIKIDFADMLLFIEFVKKTEARKEKL